MVEQFTFPTVVTLSFDKILDKNGLLIEEGDGQGFALFIEFEAWCHRNAPNIPKTDIMKMFHKITGRGRLSTSS